MSKKRAPLYKQIDRALKLIREATDEPCRCAHQSFDDRAMVAYETWLVGAQVLIIYAHADGFDIFGSLAPNSNSVDALREAVANCNEPRP